MNMKFGKQLGSNFNLSSSILNNNYVRRNDVKFGFGKSSSIKRVTDKGAFFERL